MSKSNVIGKILIVGNLRLKSPLLIGDGAGDTPKKFRDAQDKKSDNFRDIHTLKNRQGKPFIPGTSLCGVLRDWLASVDAPAVPKIFGDLKEMQSSIQVDDITLDNGEIIYRDGVRIDSVTGTGVDGGKYDYEAVERGATGEFRLLITLRGVHDVKKISDVVARLLGKLQDGIQLGALTSKGFGLAAAENLQADFYDFRNKADVAAWFTGKSAAQKILPSTEDISASENDFVVEAQFKFNSSFIIRDGDSTLKSREDFVLPGTSLKGILRHRAEYILSKFGIDAAALENLMGASLSDKKIKSRFIVAESYIAHENFDEVEHKRTKIDRFTGGTLQGTLFSTTPVYQKNFDAPTLNLRFEIRDAEDSEAGLAIFLLRDLWLGRVAVGGEKSIGRGTLNGLSATINFRGKTYTLGSNGKVLGGDKTELENFAAALKNFAGGDGK